MAEGKKKVIVSVRDSHLKKIQQVAKNLRSAGMEVEQVLEAVGAITGNVSSSRFKSLQGVEGVAALEEDRSYQLPPPESELQ